MITYSNTYSSPMPLDRCTITTSFPLHPDVISDTAEFENWTGLEIREFHPKTKFIKGEEYLSATLHIGSYGGISLHTKKSPDGCWRGAHIHLNPGRILYGHNGRSLSEGECLVAFTILINLLTPLLAEPDDAIHLLPGISPESHAYWSRIEIPLNVLDIDGNLQKALRNPSHRSIRKRAMRVDGESVKLGSSRGQLQISIYRKDIEMRDYLKSKGASEVYPVLRAEVILKGDKLVKQFAGNGNTREIDGQLRLTRFTGADLVAAHLSICSELKGCCSQLNDDATKPDNNRLGRFIAHVIDRSELSLDDLVSILTDRFAISPNTQSRLRIAARDELERISPYKVEDVFSKEAFENQASITVPEIEIYLEDRLARTDADPSVSVAYSSLCKSSSTFTPF